MTQTDGAPAEVLRARDFIGWEVVDRAGEKLGTVSDLLLDRHGKVQFIELEYGLPRKNVILPDEELEWGDRRFILGRWTRDEARALPTYNAQRPLEPNVLEEMRAAYPWFYSEDADEWRAGPTGEGRIVPLSEARGFKLESGAPNLSGWNVFGSDGERVGTVDQMLVDPAAMKIRFVSVDLHDDLFQLQDDRHVLVPLEFVDLKERGNDAWVRGATAAQIARLPAYTGGTVNPAMERHLERVFGTV